MRRPTPPLTQLTQLAYQAIRRRIVTCALAPGASVSEAGLAEAHGLTLAPVRAALARLTAEGLLVARPRSAHVVAPVTIADALEIYTLREVLQAHATAEACGRVDAEALTALNRSCIKVEGDRTRFIAANTAFHMAVTDAAGSPRLSRLVAELLDLSERIHHLGLQQRNDRPLPPWREPLIGALVSDSPDVACAIMAGHLAVVRTMTLEALLRHPAIRDRELSADRAGDACNMSEMAPVRPALPGRRAGRA